MTRKKRAQVKHAEKAASQLGKPSSVDWSDGAIRNQLRMSEEQWVAMKDRFAEAFRAHAKQVDVLEARYVDSLFSLAMKIATEAQDESLGTHKARSDPPPSD